jgi:hypothetical protein
MRVRHLILRGSVCGTLFLWIALTARSEAQTPGGVDNAIATLRQVADNLNDGVKLYQAHLDREIALHDGGYRAAGGRRIPGADADFNSGQAGVVQAAIRKLFAARMIAARRQGYSPIPLDDARHIQDLIADARTRIDAGNGVMRRLLVVSASELNQRTYAEQKARHDDLMKARNAAVEAAKRALVALPVALPEADSAEDQREKAWDLMVAKRDTPVLPIRFEEGKRILLVNEHFCKVTLTDSGIEDHQGRHLFYEEEWMTRQGSVARTTGTGPAGIVVWKRWAVAVNTTTGQHTLLRRYEAREFKGDFDDLYQLQEIDYVPNPASRERSSPPSLQELTLAVASLERSRDELRDAVLDLRRQNRDALTRSDGSLDEDLPPDLRESLFSIRAHLAGTTAILKTENNVRLALEEASGSVRAFEALDAWVNGNALEKETPARDSRILLEARSRSDAGIYLIRSLQREARAALPPEIPTPEALLPALKKDFIVRIRRMGGSAGGSGPVKLKQEVWRIEGSAQGFRQVKRTIVAVEIESKSGSQVPRGREVKYYPLDASDTLEEIYDENAAQ